jgi:uncharacterized protein YndB with AHSA1/START domain
VSHTDAADEVVGAPPEAVFAALVDPEARTQWLPPDGMTGRFERFDARPGGGYRMVLTYDDRATSGKSEANADVVEVRFTVIDEPHRVVEEAEFVSEDLAFAGTMTMTWSLEPDHGGTRVTITATGVPDGISSTDHQEAFASTLRNLDAYLRPQRPEYP